MTNTTSKPVLILGGTGKTGRRLAERLEARNIPVRIGSRSANPAFDWTDKASWAGALEGVGAVYINYYPDLTVPGAAEAIEEFAMLAVSRGVRRLVLLSGRGEPEAQRAEEMVKATGADWTILRCSWFAQNFSESAFLDGVLAGQISVPAAEIGEPFVDADDIADVAAEVLSNEGHIGELYELTGPRLLTFREAVAEIARGSGRDIAYSRVSPEEFKAELAAYGTPADIVWLLDELFVRVLDGRNEYLTDGVQRALGREPKDFSIYVRETAATGVWNADL
ncbi:NAD(P)H-binding protein [Mesorhizobium sp. 1M-11]|uniref:NAD(P)H-binding protein n=1 Tax=Mesorhizobium sp. 1M-11 TaxID=1529006 RepID=UPI0006C76CB8|nr:NAD(P)H-binding protein [Mesorhizobium sp. 1M-11]